MQVLELLRALWLQSCVAQEIFFQASNVKLLAREFSLSQFVLLHVAPYQVVRGIDSSYWPHSLLKRELLNEGRDEKGNVPYLAKTKLAKRSIGRLQLPSENDQMMHAYLQYPFFKRFKCILVNTVGCEYSELLSSCQHGKQSWVQIGWRFRRISDTSIFRCQMRWPKQFIKSCMQLGAVSFAS